MTRQTQLGQRYDEYLRSPEWKVKREQVLARDLTCVLCASAKKLQVHHRTYERLGNEELTDLVTLCDDCHSDWHKIQRMRKAEKKIAERKAKEQRKKAGPLKVSRSMERASRKERSRNQVNAMIDKAERAQAERMKRRRAESAERLAKSKEA